MSYVVFARKWRPRHFDEVIGQEHITTTLKNAITNNRVAHAYIFTGPRGTGKTSAARILAKGLNCEKGPIPAPCDKCASCNGILSGTSMDVIEIDGASNNSVDQVRELRENIKFSPSYGRHKIYIIDEVHMLSIGAFNALLKILEEPPKHAKFIFATTNPEKVPLTILSRCQRFDFRRIPLNLIISKLKKISGDENLKIAEEAIFSIARSSDGSMRDAESILDQLSSFCEKKIDQDDVIALLGIIEEDRLSDIVQKLYKKDAAGLLKSIDGLIAAGKDISQFLAGLMGYIRNLMILKVSPDLAPLIDLPDNHIERLKGEIRNFRIETLLYIFYTISGTANAIKRSEASRFIVEAAFIKLSMMEEMMSLPEIMEKISNLDTALGAKREVIAEEPKEAAEKETPPQIQAPPPPLSVAKTRSNAAVTVEEVKKAWPQVLELIKKKKISIASYLLEGEIMKAEGSAVTLNFPTKFNLHKEVIEQPSNKNFVEEIASQVLGLKVKLDLVVSKRDETPSEDIGAFSEAGPAKQELESEVNIDFPDDSIIKSAIKIFGGKIVKNEGRQHSGD